MTRFQRAVALLPVLLLVAALPSSAATAREMYAAAVARAKALRTVVENGRATTTVTRYRRTIAAFENVVRQHPGTGYADNALWEAATLAAEAHERFGDARDQAAAARLLAWLVSEYPSSPLLEKAREELKRTAKPRQPAPPARRDVAIPRSAPVLPTSKSAAPARSEADERPLGGSAAEPLPPAGGAVVLRDLRRTVLGDVVRVTLQLDAEVTYHSERVENPPRLLFDLASTRLGPAVPEGSLSYSGDIVRHVRVGRHPNQVTRVVLDLDGVKRYSVFTLYSPYRIVVDCEHDRALTASVPNQRIDEESVTLPPPEPEPPPPDLAARIPARVTTRTLAPAIVLPWPLGAGAALAQPVARSVARGPATARAVAPAPTTTTPLVVAGPPLRPSRVVAPTRRFPAWQPSVRMPPPIVLPAPTVLANERAEPPAKTNASNGEKPPTPSRPMAVPPNGFSLARQLGLGASRIVLDPGHGGHDPGAEGPGVFEAHVVLDVALRLEKLLMAAGSEVVMTRRTDEYVALEERTAIANRAQGDLFLSIHANASRNRTARGVETYFLNFATNPEAEAVAARENASTGRTMSNLTDIVRAITLNNKLDESKNFAGVVQRQMVEHLKSSNHGLSSHGVKQAPFVVLIGASMPSVLVEVSFITHSQEGRLLKTAPFRQKIAEALFDAIRGYQKSLKGTAAVTNQ